MLHTKRFCNIKAMILFMPMLLLLLPATIQAATEYNRYLEHLFLKYGNGGTMSFEGLEHLMYNLGLGQLEFESSHTINEHFNRPPDFKIDDSINLSRKNTKLFPVKDISDDDFVKTDTADNDDASTVDGLVRKVEKQLHEGERVILEFKEMHDPKHRHPRENDVLNVPIGASTNVCLSPKSLLRLVVNHDDIHKRKLYKTMPEDHAHNIDAEYDDFVNYIKLTPVTFMKLCPALLAQIDQQVCVRPAPLMQEPSESKNAVWMAWIYASASLFILSACGLLGILLVPLMKSAAYQDILKFLVAIAVGTLSGDALMHLIPHALMIAAEHKQHEEPHEHHAHQEDDVGHQHDMSAVWICGCTFAVAVFMYMLENLLPLLKSESNRGHGHSHAGHDHNHGAAPAVNNNAAAAENRDAKEINMMMNEFRKDQKAPAAPLTPLALMVVIGDGLHNLTDGLAIGAAFITAPVTGFATAFAVLCHELPHELGDFALLLQTGVSLKRAVCLNIVSSVLSFAGMAIGLLIAGSQSNMTQWIYAGTAGSFLYIAFADLIPAMSEQDAAPASSSSEKLDDKALRMRKLKDTLVRLLGIVMGGLIMLLIALKEDDLEKLFQ